MLNSWTDNVEQLLDNCLLLELGCEQLEAILI